MTVVKVVCPECGDVDLTDGDVRLFVCSNVLERSFYEFDCAGCVCLVRKPASVHVIGLLRSARVVESSWCVPGEALEVHAGSPLGPDDLLDFVVWLGGVSRLAAFV